ncbi:MAG: peptidoglycan editing factor PgeF [Alphaproteobacteria bacterium]|nr:peptidoglycan editing factor PgeF [Alphaproteobacteria bacterium]
MTLQPLRSPDFAALENIRHGFFTREGGVSEGVYASLNNGWKSGDDVTRVEENRRRVATTLGVEPAKLLSCYQIHSPMVVAVEKPWAPAERPEADAMVTAQPGIALGILTADCVPVLLADSGAGVIGAAHAGWRGAVAGVIENTVEAMGALGARPGRIVGAIGPCIWQNSYEVGPEFPAPFMALGEENEKFFRPAFRSGHYMFDLPGFCIARLRALGVVIVSTSPADTHKEPERFFSYRRTTQQGGGKTGSLISAICLVQ